MSTTTTQVDYPWWYDEYAEGAYGQGADYLDLMSGLLTDYPDNAVDYTLDANWADKYTDGSYGSDSGGSDDDDDDGDGYTDSGSDALGTQNSNPTDVSEDVWGSSKSKSGYNPEDARVTTTDVGDDDDGDGIGGGDDDDEDDDGIPDGEDDSIDIDPDEDYDPYNDHEDDESDSDESNGDAPDDNSGSEDEDPEIDQELPASALSDLEVDEITLPDITLTEEMQDALSAQWYGNLEASDTQTSAEEAFGQQTDYDWLSDTYSSAIEEGITDARADVDSEFLEYGAYGGSDYQTATDEAVGSVEAEYTDEMMDTMGTALGEATDVDALDDTRISQLLSAGDYLQEQNDEEATQLWDYTMEYGDQLAGMMPGTEGGSSTSSDSEIDWASIIGSAAAMYGAYAS